MFPASLILTPLAPVLAERSAPARSTMEILMGRKVYKLEPLQKLHMQRTVGLKRAVVLIYK